MYMYIGRHCKPYIWEHTNKIVSTKLLGLHNNVMFFSFHCAFVEVTKC